MQMVLVFQRKTKEFPCGEWQLQQMRSGGNGVVGTRGSQLSVCIAYHTQLLMVQSISCLRNLDRQTYFLFSSFCVFSCVGPTFETFQIPITWIICVKKVILLNITEIWRNDCRFYSRAARADARVNKRAINSAALALLDHEQLSYWPSTVAAALVILASVEDASCKRVMQVSKPVLKAASLDECDVFKHQCFLKTSIAKLSLEAPKLFKYAAS